MVCSPPPGRRDEVGPVEDLQAVVHLPEAADEPFLEKAGYDDGRQVVSLRSIVRRFAALSTLRLRLRSQRVPSGELSAVSSHLCAGARRGAAPAGHAHRAAWTCAREEAAPPGFFRAEMLTLVRGRVGRRTGRRDR